MADTPDDFQYTLAAMITDAVSFIDEEISPQRAKAIRYYRGDLFGDEQSGRSKVVSRDVHDTIQSLLPSIQRTFFGAEKMVEYAPRGPEDVQAAEQATDYSNFVLEQDNDWYMEFYQSALDGLLHGDGILKVAFEESEDVSVNQFTGLDEAAVTILASEEGELEVGQAADGSFDAVLKRKRKVQRFRVRSLPLEEFLIDRRATSFEDAEICAHRCHLTVNELIDMGYDREQVMELVGDNELTSNAETIERQPYKLQNNAESINESMRRVLYVEAYTRYDLDGDGLAERIKVCCGGPGYDILAVEPYDYVPFAKLSMCPNPHAFFSEGMFDRLYDVQRINSQVLRLTLDSLGLSVFPRTGVVEGDGNIEDVLNNEIGAIIRMKTPNGVTPMVTPFAGQAAFPVLDYMRQVKEMRTGISGASMGMSPELLNNATKELAAATVQSGQGQIELICRHYANGLKRLYKLLLQMFVAHQDRPRMIRLRNEFIEIDPRPWNANMDVTVNVALSAGTIQERMMMLQYQWEKQSETYSALGPNNGVVSLGHIRNTASKIVELSGFKDASQFWAPVPLDYDMPPQDPAQDPNAQATQALAEAEQMKAQLQFQSAQMKAELDLMAKREKLQSDQQAAMAKLAMEQQKLELQRQQLVVDLELQRAKLMQQMAKDERDAAMQMVQQAEQGQEQGEVERKDDALAKTLMALGQMIQQVQESQHEVAEAVSAPKAVIRDEMGRISGVKTVEGD